MPLRTFRTSVVCRLSSVVLVLAFLLAPSYPHAALAQQTPSVVVDAQTVKPHFPDKVDFSLKAHGFDASRAELNYRLVGDPVTAEQAVPLDNPTSNLSINASLDLSTHYIPPGSQVAYYWTLAGNADQLAYTPEQTFTMPDDRYSWHTLTDNGKHVSVHWYDGDSSFGNDLLSTSTEALGRLQTEIRSGLRRPANVWVYSSQDDLLNALPKNIPEWVGGKAFPDLALVLAAVSPDFSADEEIKRVVPHELSHLVLYQATLNPYNTPPAWMDEGLAVHNQEAQDPAEEEALRDAAARGKLIPLKALSGSFGADVDTATLSYAESRSVMDFVLSDSRYGPDKFAKTVAAFKGGVTYDDALEAGLGISVDELDREWQASLPYKQAQQPGQSSTSQTPVSGTSIQIVGTDRFSWSTIALVAGLGICAGLFLAGGIVTLIVLLRRRPASGR